jgi:hypothetical protein
MSGGDRSGDGSSQSNAGEEGRWVVPALSYVDPGRRFCAWCGRPIARRYWEMDVEGKPLPFCDAAHATRYTTYPKSSEPSASDTHNVS